MVYFTFADFSAKKAFYCLENLFLINGFISAATALIVEEFLLSSWAFPFV
jgi:hypothetical protein